MDIRKLQPDARLLEREEAIELAEMLSDDDPDGWAYRVRAAKIPGKYHIEVTDETGEVLGDI